MAAAAAARPVDGSTGSTGSQLAGDNFPARETII